MNKLARAYGNMLDREWNYFSTLTYKWPVKQNSNRKIMDRLANTLYEKDKKFEMFWFQSGIGLVVLFIIIYS
jgi:hypothetical protein